MGRPSAPALTTRKAMQSPLSTAFTVVFCICVGFFAVEKGTMLYEEYVMQALIIRKDLDFLKKCKTAEGYASMNHHPNFCEKIIATAEVGAFWHAVRRVSGSLPFEEMMGVFQRLSWQFMAVLAVLTLVFPSLIISQWRSRQDYAHRGYQDDYKRMV
jgi:hypothetical protein